VSNLTPADIIDTLSRIGREIDEATATIADLDEAAVRAKAEYKKGYARAFLTCEGSMDVRRYTAELEMSDAYFTAELADQELRAEVSRLRALRDRLEIGRSLGPLIRLEWGQA